MKIIKIKNLGWRNVSKSETDCRAAWFANGIYILSMFRDPVYLHFEFHGHSLLLEKLRDMDHPVFLVNQIEEAKQYFNKFIQLQVFL